MYVDATLYINADTDDFNDGIEAVPDSDADADADAVDDAVGDMCQQLVNGRPYFYKRAFALTNILVCFLLSTLLYFQLLIQLFIHLMVFSSSPSCCFSFH